MPQHLAALALLVRDYDEAIAYYTGTLGFELIEDTDMGRGKRFVRVRPPGSTGAAFLLAKATNADQQSRVGNQTGGRVFLFLHTDDFQRDHAAYKAKGVKFMMINPNMHDTPEMIAKEAKEFDITMPILKDSDQSVTEPWGVPATVADAAPLPAMMPATCVPWPSTSRRIAGTESTVKTRLVRSG